MEPNCSSDCVCVPSEIYTLILSYLPVKSLLRFRSVSQEWKSIIENRDFASLHLSHYVNNRLETHVIALQDRYENLWYHQFPVSQIYGQKVEYDFSGPAETFNRQCSVFGGHLDGVILVQQQPWLDSGEVVLWNPSIRKYKNIPPPPSYAFTRDSFLGFDPSTNDYKVVSMSLSGDQTILEVFSLYSNSWRTRSSEVGVWHNLVGSKRVSLGGFVHWLGTCSNGVPYEKCLVSFNMTSETCSHTLLPNMLEVDIYEVAGPIVSGSLIGFLTLNNDTIEIWMLDKDEQWSKRFRFYGSIDYIYKWLYLDRYGVLIWSEIDSKVVASDVNSGKRKVVLWNDWYSMGYVGTYIESLVLLS